MAAVGAGEDAEQRDVAAGETDPFGGGFGQGCDGDRLGRDGLGCDGLSDRGWSGLHRYLADDRGRGGGELSHRSRLDDGFPNRGGGDHLGRCGGRCGLTDGCGDNACRDGRWRRVEGRKLRHGQRRGLLRRVHHLGQRLRRDFRRWSGEAGGAGHRRGGCRRCLGCRDADGDQLLGLERGHDESRDDRGGHWGNLGSRERSHRGGDGLRGRDLRCGSGGLELRRRDGRRGRGLRAMHRSDFGGGRGLGRGFDTCGSYRAAERRVGRRVRYASARGGELGEPKLGRSASAR